MSWYPKSSHTPPPEDMIYMDKLSEILTPMTRGLSRKGPAKILPHLYLGNYDNALDVDNLHKLGITHVLNTAEGYTSTGPAFYAPKIEYKGFAGEDDHQYDIFQHFDMTRKFIDEAKASGGICLIHCLMGINRSGALAVGYYMLETKTPLIEAVRSVKSHRAILLVNQGFQEQLIKFARKHHMLESIDEEPTPDPPRL
ncbi:unnamed protein product [Owenia fusiformis]|uniref:Dual specificity protein phosphatase n=1 Tax=Owenia fusiformis TaxID=6347 RepID=A0A8J1T5T0_OWEFU|nr:unnamed protein product [Owenia fusiformis]